MNSMVLKRITTIRQDLAEKKLDALMVSVPENRYYLSGFSAEDTQFDESAGVLIISDRHLVLATDSRYEVQAQSEAAGFEIVCHKKGIEEELPDIIRSLGIRRLGFESVRLSQKNYSACANALSKMYPPVEMVPTENLVESLRQIKSDDEIQRTIEKPGLYFKLPLVEELVYVEDRLLFFTRPDCAPCDALLARLLTRIERIAGVDIYLAGIDPGDDQAVRDWAAKHGIDPDWVRARKVTLNFEAGALAELTDGQGEVPMVIRRRGEALAVLSPAAL